MLSLVTNHRYGVAIPMIHIRVKTGAREHSCSRCSGMEVDVNALLCVATETMSKTVKRIQHSHGSHVLRIWPPALCLMRKRSLVRSHHGAPNQPPSFFAPLGAFRSCRKLSTIATVFSRMFDPSAFALSISGLHYYSQDPSTVILRYDGQEFHC